MAAPIIAVAARAAPVAARAAPVAAPAAGSRAAGSTSTALAPPAPPATPTPTPTPSPMPGGAPAPGVPTPPGLPPAPAPAAGRIAPPAPAPPPTPAPAAGRIAPPAPASPPPSGPSGVGGGGSSVAAFDRPQPVIIVGPRPLPVAGDFGRPGKGGKEEDGGPKTTFTKVMEGIQKAAPEVGRFGQAAARNDAGGVLGGAKDAAVKGLEKLGPAGKAAGVALETVAAVAKAAHGVITAFVERGRELSGYHGGLAASTARADVQNTLNDIREAQTLGDETARMQDKLTSMDSFFREVLLPIKEMFLRVGNWLMDVVQRVLDGLLAGAENVVRLLHDLIDFFTDPPGWVKTALDHIASIRGILAGTAPVGDPMEAWLRASDRFVPPPLPAPTPVPVGPLGVPII